MTSADALAFPRWPKFATDEVEAVADVLRSGKVNYWGGEHGSEFEREFATYCGVEHGIVLANGSLALELALHALDIGPGDEVVVTPRSFIASASSVVLRGATPVFADVDEESQNLTAATILKAMTPRTKAVIVVHLAGWPCEMDEILDLARAHDVKVIEDCAQAHGAFYRERPVGSWGDAATFSFCQDKILTTGGEGGLLLLRDRSLWERAWAYKDHGKSYAAAFERKHLPGFRWMHESFGTNWRMTEMQAAIGRKQLGKLDGWVETRRAHAANLTAAFRKLPALRVPEPPPHLRHAYYRLGVRVRSEALREGWNRDRILSAVNQQKVPCFVGACPEIYREKAFEVAGLAPIQSLPVAAELGRDSLVFLVHPTLEDEHVARTAEVVATVLREASR